MNTSEASQIIPLEKSYFPLRLTEATKKPLWRKLTISTLDETRFIPFEEIIYCMSSSNYSTVFLRNGKSCLCTKTLKYIESRLPSETFVRIHDSYLVNLQSITALKKSTSEIEIENKLLLPVSRRQRKGLYELLGIK